MDPEIVASLTDPLLTAELAAIAVGFKESRRRWESLGQRHERRRQAAEEVAFIASHAALTAADPLPWTVGEPLASVLRLQLRRPLAEAVPVRPAHRIHRASKLPVSNSAPQREEMRTS